jgi:hypothetical protein
MMLSAFLLSACTGTLLSVIVSPALDGMQQQSDIELVCEGTPAYLLMVDSMIASNPQDDDTLLLGAKAYSGYIGVMQECGMSRDRIAAMAAKAHLYGTQLLGGMLPISPADTREELGKRLARLTKNDTPKLFWGVFAWITWIEQQQGTPESLADLGKIEALLLKTIELDEKFQSGAAHFLLGAYYGSRPQMFGGKPELSKFHFERALVISKRKMLIYQTTCAQTLARLTVDKELHDSLLREVIDFDISLNPENMLANQIAQRKAKRLLQDNFFADN